MCTILAVMLLMFSVDPAQAAKTVDSLGNTSPAFDDGAMPGIIQLINAQSGQPAPFDAAKGSNPLTYLWDLTTVPIGSTASLTGSTTSLPSFVADLAGNYAVELVVNDGTEDSEPDTVSITAAFQAEPSFTLHNDPSDGATGFKVDINRVFDPITGEDVSVLLESFRAQLTYQDPSNNPSFPPSSRRVNILEVREMAIPITSRAIDDLAGSATFDGSHASGVSAPTDFGHALTRLTGSANQQSQVRTELTSLSDVDSNPISVPTTLTQMVQRGDARADGNVTMADALFISQNLVGSRPACTLTVDTACLHSVNAASVRHDCALDEQNIADAQFIAEYLLGLRDEFYNLVP